MEEKNTVPQHIAVIMDGNRRWAKERGFASFAGHKKVSDGVLEPLIEHAADSGVKFITFWAWSTENWGRTPIEVKGIMDLFREVIVKKWKRLQEKGVRIKTIGDLSKFPDDIQKSVAKVIADTNDNTRITAIFALNYGGRDEIIRAIHTVEPAIMQTILAADFSALLDTKEIPDPEMIIRTGGEQRLSGFLLWQSEYSELFFPSWYMPEFTPEKLDGLLSEYSQRARRFGK